MNTTAAPRISFCTNCMGRLSQLQQTLPANLRLADDPAQFEFVLLNYHSTDGLDEWVHRTLRTSIEAGLLSYYHTTQPRFFSMAHAKNVAHLLAASSIVCNVDGDNFITPAFLNFLQAVFREHAQGVFCGFNGPGIGSRIAIPKSDFLRLGGYDEEMWRGWGPDDADFALRAARSGMRQATTLNVDLLGQEIKHPDSGRNENTELRLPKEESENKNKDMLIDKARKGVVQANAGKPWGVELVRPNFKPNLMRCQAEGGLLTIRSAHE